jgi:hypothetical protein
LSFAVQHKWDNSRFGYQKAAGITGGLEARYRTIYSAATFRGGSSAPESWISAT